MLSLTLTLTLTLTLPHPSCDCQMRLPAALKDRIEGYYSLSLGNAGIGGNGTHGTGISKGTAKDMQDMDGLAFSSGRFLAELSRYLPAPLHWYSVCDSNVDVNLMQSAAWGRRYASTLCVLLPDETNRLYEYSTSSTNGPSPCTASASHPVCDGTALGAALGCSAPPSAPPSAPSSAPPSAPSSALPVSS
jgi:hypothetical protein